MCVTVKATLALFILAGGIFASGTSAAQPFPTKPVRIIVSFAPGGGNDLTARVVAQLLTERVKQSFIVENRVGASGIIGTEFVVKSAPDGYTLLMGSQTTQAVVPAM
jgi:tripartite-type tricarboxylate transporter receptor subunit TctC